jgi:hypothetical protein
MINARVRVQFSFGICDYTRFHKSAIYADWSIENIVAVMREFGLVLGPDWYNLRVLGLNRGEIGGGAGNSGGSISELFLGIWIR